MEASSEGTRLEEDELEEVFHDAIARCAAFAIPPTEIEKLELYGLLQQAFFGDALLADKPHSLSTEFGPKAKFQAHYANRGKTPEVAMTEYVLYVERLAKHCEKKAGNDIASRRASLSHRSSPRRKTSLSRLNSQHSSGRRSSKGSLRSSLRRMHVLHGSMNMDNDSLAQIIKPISSSTSLGKSTSKNLSSTTLGSLNGHVAASSGRQSYRTLQKEETGGEDGLGEPVLRPSPLSDPQIWKG
ncbi:uncharacterized protein AMSG_03998 [Thecamonas trahens ATCC 50062]|uniref:ACB domain-containing protein n=1 Tax=Thecamonas trahens ATCC 50062 TaxID=461836 RepID=A0A0L0D6Q9_THETB|nr:hypothetical protein AMSG_03998 [Thecamonas trahens ATCC 50062]KNC47771.1 hypothetical protein AMSG_03998 [Thecamonas trahens ATCC 50062]|eukprot:XP_013759249.1 hypothetical protein AMSG_03998 [Thecamonas trahens ATCC 50062]